MQLLPTIFSHVITNIIIITTFVLMCQMFVLSYRRHQVKEYDTMFKLFIYGVGLNIFLYGMNILEGSTELNYTHLLSSSLANSIFLLGSLTLTAPVVDFLTITIKRKLKS